MDEIINPNKVDMSKNRTPEEWGKLLDLIKVNNDDYLTRTEQSYYIDEVNYKITGKRPSKYNTKQILAEIEQGAADIDDINQ